jgi:hypothetical protein
MNNNTYVKIIITLTLSLLSYGVIAKDSTGHDILVFPVSWLEIGRSDFIKVY